MKLFVRVTGIVTFLILGFFAILFYRERTLTFDMALLDFFIILRKTAFVYLIRFGDVLLQIPPLAYRWLNCPLKQILVVHSMWFVGFYFLFFLTITFILKEQWVAVSFLLFQVLFVNDTFYWIPSEIPQGIAFLFLYYAWLGKRKLSQINQHPFLHFLIILFIQFYHLLLIAPILFVVLYSLHKQYQLRIVRYIKPVLLVIVSFCVRLLIGKLNWYEADKLDFIPALQSNMFHFFRLESTHLLIRFAATDYLIYFVLLAITLLLLVMERRFYLTALLFFFTIGYVVDVCSTQPQAQKFYLENMLLPVSVFLLLPMTDFFFKRIAGFQPLFMGVILLIIALRLVSVYNTHTVYTRRLDWYTLQFRAMENSNMQRIVMQEKDVPMDTMIMTWASGYESLLLSSIESPVKSKAIVITGDVDRFTSSMKNDTLLLPGWESPSLEIQANYFNMKPGYFVVKEK